LLISWFKLAVESVFVIIGVGETLRGEISSLFKPMPLMELVGSNLPFVLKTR
jgi:hypothetical protein